jgi:hypothetical protein
MGVDLARFALRLCTTATLDAEEHLCEEQIFRITDKYQNTQALFVGARQTVDNCLE